MLFDARPAFVEWLGVHEREVAVIGPCGAVAEQTVNPTVPGQRLEKKPAEPAAPRIEELGTHSDPPALETQPPEQRTAPLAAKVMA